MESNFTKYPILTITIVSWNTKQLTLNCLNSVLTKSVKDVAEIHVVDNNSHDGSAEMIRQNFPDVKLFSNKENLGFARANNQSWQKAKGRYWLLLNSDTIVNPGAIEKLIAFMDSHPQAGMATAKLLNPDGTPQYCAAREQSIFFNLLEFTRLHKLLTSKMRGKWLLGSYFDYNHPQKLGWAWGTALIVRRDAIDNVGILSEDYFMYGEDLEWSLRMRRKNWEVWFCPEAEVIHYGGQSSKQTWSISEKDEIILDNCYQAMEEHRGKHYVKMLQVTSLGISFIELIISRIRGQVSLTSFHRSQIDYYRKKLKA